METEVHNENCQINVDKSILSLTSPKSTNNLQSISHKRILSTKHTHSLRRSLARNTVLSGKRQSSGTTCSTGDVNITSFTAIGKSGTVRNYSSRRIKEATVRYATPKPLISDPSQSSGLAAITQASTMREVLASIPGFCLKPRRRSSKKISTALQIEQTKDGKIDLETPDSILTSTNLRALLNKQTFSMLPPLYQYNLIQLLPSVDRESVETERILPLNKIPMETIRLGSSSLNNEFFARACLEWRERLAEGEFTPENQLKLKTEAEREKHKLDPWKLKHFEPIWGGITQNRFTTIELNSESSSLLPRSNQNDALDNVRSHSISPTKSLIRNEQLKLKEQITENSNAQCIREQSFDNLNPIKSCASETTIDMDSDEINFQLKDDTSKSDICTDMLLKEYESANNRISTETTASVHCQNSESKFERKERTDTMPNINLSSSMDSMASASLITNNEKPPPERNSTKLQINMYNMNLIDTAEFQPTVTDSQIQMEIAENSESEMQFSADDTLFKSENVNSTCDMVSPVISSSKQNEPHNLGNSLKTDTISSPIQEGLDDDNYVSIPDKMESQEYQCINPKMNNTFDKNSIFFVDNAPMTGLSLNSTISDTFVTAVSSSLRKEIKEPDIKNELIHHVRHDWNFGDDIKSTDSNVSLSETTNVVGQEHKDIFNLHPIQEMDLQNIPDKLQTNIDEFQTKSQHEMESKNLSEVCDVEGCTPEMEVSSTVITTSSYSGNNYDINSGVDNLSATRSMDNVHIAKHTPVENSSPQTYTISNVKLSQQRQPIQNQSQFCQLDGLQEQKPIQRDQVQDQKVGNMQYQKKSTGVNINHMDKRVQILSQHSMIQNSKQVLSNPTHITSIPFNVIRSQIQQFQNLSNANASQSTSKHIPEQLSGILIGSSSSGSIFDHSVANIPSANALSLSSPHVSSNHITHTLVQNHSSNKISSSGIPASIAQQKTVVKSTTGKGRKPSHNKLPPGAVNLERSYQICQAVIQNSPNRENLRAQLRPPSEILNQADCTKSHESAFLNAASYATVSKIPAQVSTLKSEEHLPVLQGCVPPNILGVGRPGVYKVVGPRMGFPRKKYVQRKPSPSMIRHVFSSQHISPIASVHQTKSVKDIITVHSEASQISNGQYLLVHRSNVGAADNQAPRASSAPPVPQQNPICTNQIVGITGRGRPASVDVELYTSAQENTHPLNSPSVMGITHRTCTSGNISYGDDRDNIGSNHLMATVVQTLQNTNENSASFDATNCGCSFNPMLICKQCGAFCHDDCISSSNLCISCVLR